MIIRVWRGRTRAEDADRYTDYLRETGVSDARSTPGNRGVLVGRRIQGEDCEFFFLSLWDSIESIKGFAGSSYDRARYYTEDEAYLRELPPDIDHFEVAAFVRGDE